MKFKIQDILPSSKTFQITEAQQKHLGLPWKYWSSVENLYSCGPQEN
jgi:hypothetical protein